MTGNDQLSDVIDRLAAIALDDALSSRKGNDTLSPRISEYSSIKEYYEKTGKRFRISKNQKERGLSREDAFKEFTQKRK